MLRLCRPSDRGDTLIEVLFAVSIFSLVAVGGLAIMNQGSAAAERALEITLVREQMDAQAQTLRFLNSSYVAAFEPGATYGPSTPAGQWALMVADIKANPITIPSTLGGSSCPTTPKPGDFILDPLYATFHNSIQGMIAPAKTFSQLDYTTDSTNKQVYAGAEGIWIEAINNPPSSSDPAQANIGSIDFYIFACWDSPGQNVPMTLGTIVRLYDPL